MIVKTVLDNGIRVITEDVPAVKSVSVGVWVGCGARGESDVTNGISHFIEHMLFKGTSSRSAYDIASQIEATGGSINAFTGKEQTSYYLKIPDYHLALGLDVLADMLSNSAFLFAEIENEKGVVLSEICQLEDTPDEYIHDVFEETLWCRHPLRFPVLGSRDSVKNFSGDGLRDFFTSRYGAKNILVSIAGAIDHKKTIAIVSDLFGSVWQNGEHADACAERYPAPKPFHILRQKKTQQVNIVIGAPAFATNDSRHYTLALLNAVLGGSMSSRLFQEVREKRGLAYSIASFVSSYSDTGLFGIYAGTTRDDFSEVVSCCMSECEKITAERLSEQEMTNAKGMLKGNFLLGMESTDARMSKMAKNEFVFGRQLSTEEIINGIDAVSVDAVRDLAREILGKGKTSIAVLGDVKGRDFQKALSFVG